MKIINTKKTILLLVFAVFLFAGCKERHSKAVDLAYQLSSTAPDSALSILNGVEPAKLGKSEMARYALVYTIAQDKSGLDVDNDSLIRIAYTYYNNREDDSLYAMSEYYMGKYYMLNDSTEESVKCLRKSIAYSENRNDLYTESLALDKLAKIYYLVNPNLHISYSVFSVFEIVPVCIFMSI